MSEKTIPLPEEVTSIAIEGSSKRIVKDCFREIGFDTAMWPGKVQETIFFISPDRKDRRTAASPEAVAEFIAYWENQLQVAREYLANGCNPNTHEWKTVMEPARIRVVEGNVVFGPTSKLTIPVADLQSQWKSWDRVTDYLRTFDPKPTAEEWTVLEVIANTTAAKNGLSETKQALERTVKV